MAALLRRSLEGFDALLLPAFGCTAYPHIPEMDWNTAAVQIDGRPEPLGAQSFWQSVATLPGLPATVAPIGHGSDGLPIGMQVIGPMYEDRTPLALVRHLEACAPGPQPAPDGRASASPTGERIHLRRNRRAPLCARMAIGLPIVVRRLPGHRDRHGRQGLHAAAVHALHAVGERGVGVQPAFHAAAAVHIHQQHVLQGRMGQAGAGRRFGMPGRGAQALGHDLAQHAAYAVAAARPLHGACIARYSRWRDTAALSRRR